MPEVAPVAVEPRQINPPGTKKTASTTSVSGTDGGASIDEDAPEGGKKSFPLVPILAGLVGVIVLWLLVKVMKSK